MASTYTAGLTTDKDKIRWLIGDRISGQMILDDDDITAVLVLQPSLGHAASACCHAIAAYYAYQVSTSNGRIAVGAQERLDHFTKLAIRLSKKGTDPFDGKEHTPAAMKVGGIELADKEALDLDKALVQPTFKRTGNDHPGRFTINDADVLC